MSFIVSLQAKIVPGQRAHQDQVTLSFTVLINAFVPYRYKYCIGVNADGGRKTFDRPFMPGQPYLSGNGTALRANKQAMDRRPDKNIPGWTGCDVADVPVDDPKLPTARGLK
jgi:hypothetical protein